MLVAMRLEFGHSGVVPTEGQHSKSLESCVCMYVQGCDGVCWLTGLKLAQRVQVPNI